MVNGKRGRTKRLQKTRETTRVRRGRTGPFEILPPPVPPIVKQIIPRQRVVRQPRPKPAPCGGKKPFAKTSGGKVFCTQQDFLNAGFRQPKAKKKSSRGLCPPGKSLFGGRCVISQAGQRRSIAR